MTLCPVNVASEVRLPNSWSVYIFLPIFPIFHLQSQFDAKMTSFRIVQAAIHKLFFAFRVVFRLIHVVINFPLYETVQDYGNIC